MKFLILSLLLVSTTNLFSQDVKTGTILLPVRQGSITSGSSTGVFISSNNDSCFASEDGIVSSKFRLPNEQAIVIKKAPETYVTYSNLYLTSVSRGDVIKKGTFIGLLKKNNEDYKLCFIITDSKGKIFSQESHLNYLSQNTSL